MTDQERRIATAEACGWTNIHGLEDSEGKMNCFVGTNPQSDFGFELIPNYCADLNAIHEAEKTMFESKDWEACEYELRLEAITTSWAWFATARQRNEAFLRVKGLWKD